MALDWTMSSKTTKKVWDECILEPNGVPQERFRDVVYACMLVGVPRITERSFDLFYKRYRILCIVIGNPKPDKMYLERLLGLSTNASPMTDAVFKHKMMDRLERRVSNEG